MEDTLNNRSESRKDDQVLQVAKLIEEHNGQNTLVLYIGEVSSWTDYFIISTVTSEGHLKGLYKWVKDFLSEKGIEPLYRQKIREVQDENWILIDCGEFIIHLMKKETREFYDLERLWFAGEIIYGEV